MLKVVTGELPKYPYEKKKFVKGLIGGGLEPTQARSVSLTALKNKQIQVK